MSREDVDAFLHGCFMEAYEVVIPRVVSLWNEGSPSFEFHVAFFLLVLQKSDCNHGSCSIHYFQETFCLVCQVWLQFFVWDGEVVHPVRKPSEVVWLEGEHHTFLS